MKVCGRGCPHRKCGEKGEARRPGGGQCGDLLSTGYWAANIGEIRAGDTVAVIGAGPTGLCTMLCARLFSPARIVAVDTDAYRLKLAREQGLADVTFMPGQDDAAAQIRAMTEGRGADVVFEVAGGRDT